MARDKYSDILEEMFGPAADAAEPSNIPAGTQQGLKTSTAPADVWGTPSDKLQPEFGLSDKELKDNEQAFLSEIESSNRQPVFKLDFSENAVNKDRAREESFREAFQDRIGAGALLSQEDVEPYKHTQTLSDGEELIEYRIGEESYPQQVVDQYIASYNDERLHEQRFKEDADYRNEWFLRNVGISERRYRENLANEMESRLVALKELIKPPKRQPATHTRGGYAAIGAAMNESRAQSGDGGGIASHKIDEALEKVRTLRKNNFWSGFGEGFDLGNIITMDLKNVADNVALLKALNKSSRGEQLTKSEQALVDAFEISNDAEEAIELLGGRTWLTNTGRGSAQSLGFITQMIGTGGVASAATKGITRAAAKTALKRAVNNSAASSIERALQQGALKVAESAVGAAARVPFSGYTYRTYTDKRLNQFQVEERVNEATGEVERYIGKNETSALRDAVRSALESYFEMQSEDVGGWLDYGVKSFAKTLPRKNIILRLAAKSLPGPVKNAIPKFIKRAGKIYSFGGEVLSEAYGDAMVNLLTGDDEGWRQMATKDYWWELGGVSAMLSGGFSAINRGVNWATGESKLRSQLERTRKRALDRIENEALKAKLIEASMVDDLSARSKMLASLDWGNTLTREDMANATDFITGQTKLDVGDYSAAEADRLARMVPALERLQVAAHDGEISDKELQEAISGSYARAFRVQENQQELARIADRIRMAAEAGVSADDINNIIARAGLTVYTPGDEVETLSGICGMVNRVYPGAYELVDSQGNTGVFQFEEILQPAPEVQEAQLANKEVREVHTGEEIQSEQADVVQQAVTEASNQARAQAEAIKNMDDDVVYEATMTDGTAVHIIKGKTIVYNAENGELDYEASEPTVVVQYDNGDRRLVSIRDIDSIDEAVSVDEVAEVAGQAMKSAVETMQQPAQESQQAVPSTIETAQQAGPPAAEQQAEQAPAAEIAEVTKVPVGAEPNPMIGRSLSDEEAVAVISRMEKNATVAPELELTPENWDAQFGEDGIVATPIGDVKMGENQYLKLSRKGREGKLGMVKPTLENPDVIIEEKSSAGDAAPTERNSSFVFLKAFTNADGLRMYKFASVTIRKDGREVVISNQEKETPRIKRLLKEGMLTYISDATLPSESTASAQGAQPTIPGGATLSESKNTTSAPNNQEVAQKNVAAPEIPTLKNGHPDYNAMSPEMFVEQYSAALGADKTELVARNNIKADNKAIADIEKKIAAITDPNKLPGLAAKLEAVKAHKARYVSVLEIMGLSEESEDDSTRQTRLRKDFAGRMAELFPGGFPNVESLILYDVATGVKFRWEDKDTNGSVVSRGLGAELGLSAADAERKRRIGLLASDAPTPEEYAEQLRERLDAQGIRYDETELRDKVIDVLSSVDTVGSARKALEQLAAGINQEEEALDYEDEQARRAYERERQGLAKENGSYKLSSEVDENGRQFVLSSSGNVEFGKISEESGLPPAPILLSEGMITNKATNDGYGLVHIEARHGDQIRKAGYKSAVDFIEDVAQNYEVIKEGNVRDGNNTYLLQITDKHNNTLMVELSGDGTYWNINTAGIFKTSYGKNRKEVYNRHTTAKQPAETDEASRNAEPSGTQADPSMITTSTLNSSDNKNTTSAPNNQEVAQKKVDDPGLIGDEELSVEDETPFAIADEAVPADSSVAAQLATEAAIMALEEAGIEVVEATPEMVEEALQKRDFQLQAVEQKFNEQLAGFSEENATAVIFNLGLPSPMLIAGGVVNKPIRLYGGKLLKKMRKHGFVASELKGLPTAIANPIAVFDNYRKPGNRSILTELKTADGNFLVSVDVGAGSDIDFDIVKTIFGKDGDGILNWINKGYLTVVDKEKALAYLRISAPIAEASNKQELDSATKIVENFENPKIVPGTSFSVENPSLVGLHNISEEKLRKALRMGGLANPSVAVIDSNTQQHTGYGDITLVLPSSLVAQETGKNIGTYFGDAWTPTYPQVERRMRNDQASKDIASLPDPMRNTVRLALNSWLDGRAGDALAYMFLHERGEAPELHTVKAEYSQELRDAMLALTGGKEFYYLTPEQRQQVLGLYIQKEHNGSRDEFDAHLKRAISRSEKFIAERGANSLIGKKAQEVIDTINEYGYDYDSVSRFVRDVLRDAATSGIVDAPYTALLAERKIKEDGLEQEYAKWVNSLIDRYAVEEVIFKGYTPSGNRKYVPNTLENASKEMREQGRAGATGFTVGFSRFAAQLLKPEGTLDAIRKRKGQLKTSYEEVEAFKDKWSAVLFDLAEKCQPNATGYEDYGFERLAEAATKKSPKTYLKKEYGVELSDEDAKRLDDMIKAIRTEYPVMYFETKFERPVYFNEFAGVVVPSGVSDDIVKSLKDAGLSVVTYRANDEVARMKAVKEVAATSNRVMFNIGPAPVFVSNAKIAVMGIKQEKATPEQWLKMIEKAGGLKAGEDKWLGLSDWLKDSEKKTLTKKEVLDYINENQIQIEEARYSSDSAIEATPEFAALRDEYRSILRRYEDEARRNLEEFEERMAKKYGFSDLFDTTALNDAEERAHITLNRTLSDAYLGAWGEMWDKYGDDFDRAFMVDFGGLRVNKASDARRLLHLKDDAPIYHLREEYTTRGLNGNREIALTVPTIEPWNTSDEVHFGDAGGGRAIAWIRFGETATPTDEAIAAKKDVDDYLASMREKYGGKEGEETDAMTADEINHLQSLTAKEIDSREKGLRVLVIDEIQSKRHQEGREHGYATDVTEDQVKKAREEADVAFRMLESFDEQMAQKYGTRFWSDQGTNEEYAHWELLRSEYDRYGRIYKELYDKRRKAIPAAPFDKNWAELAMKRMLRYAAENGYDKVAWTTGNQQAERYSLGAVLQGLKAYKTSPNTYYVVPYNNGAIGEFVKEYTEKELADTFGKELAAKIIANTEDATEDNPYEIEGDNLRIGGEGMKGFYDQILPSFMNKYGKKWGVKVSDITLPFVEKAGRTMHSVDVTESMRESVMHGQPMFYRRPNGVVYGWTNGKTVYLTPEGMNPNTPIHEYTHIWADAMRKNNPKGWESIVKLLKGTPMWNEVVADANYANIKDNDNQVASETLSRLSGRNNAAKMETMAQQLLDEGGNDSVKKNRARKLLDRMRKALQEFWSWVGKELFGIEKFESIDEVTDRVLYDLVSGTDLGAVPAEGIHMGQQARERAEIERAAKADGTWLKAPNGEPTNLTPWQWVTVRTKAFKNWFGDWEKAARIEKLRGSESIAIPENAYEGKYELDQASAEKYIKDNLRGEYRIEDTGESVKLTNRSAKKLLSHSYNSKAHLQSIVAIPEMIQKSVFIDEASAEKDNARYDSYRYYVCGIKIGNEDYTVRITIGVKNGAFYYDHALTEIEKGNLIEIAQGFTPSGGRTLPSYAKSKDTRIIPLLQTNSSKVVDENGEPKVVYHQTNAKVYINRDTGENWDDLDWRERMEWDERDDWDDYWVEQDFNAFSRVNARTMQEFDGFFFAPEYDEYHEYGNRTIAAFLNIRKPASREDYNIDSSQNSNAGREERLRLQADGFDGVIREYDGSIDEYVAFNPNQIKSINGNTTFDPKTDDIRFEVGNRPEGVRMDQQLTADKSFIHAYDSAFEELSSEYDALDKTDEAALKAFRAKKLDVVERYMSSMSSNLAMPTTPVIVDASDPDSVKKAYELLPDEYRKFVTFDAFIDEVSSAVGFYVADSKMSVYNISNDDTLNSSREWLGILAHENGHKAVETLGISDSDKEKLWEFCKRTTTSVRNKIERGYESAAEKGEEYLVYTIQSRARYPRLGDLLAECIMGEKNAHDVVKTFKDSLPLRDEIVEKILNYFRDGYRKARGEADYSAAAGRAKSKEEVQGFYNRFRREYSQGLRRDNSVGRDLDEILFSIGEQPLAPAAEKVEPTEEEKKAAEAEKRLQSLNRLQRSVRALVKKLHQAKEDDSDIATLIAEALETEVDKEGLQKFLDTGRFIQEITSSISKESIQASLNRMSDQIANAVIKHRKELLAKTMGIQVQTTTSMGIAIAHGVDDKTRAAIEVFRRFHKMQKPAPAYDSAGLTVGSKVLVSTKGDEAFSAFIDNNTEVNVLDKQDLMLWHTLWSDVADSEDAYITISLDINRLSEKSKELYRKIKDAPKLSKAEETLKKERKLVLETRRAKERERLEVKQQIAQSLGDLLIAISQRIDIGRHARKGQLAADDEYRRDYLNRAMEDIRVGNVVTAYDKGVPKELIEKKKKDQSLWGFYKEHYYSFVYMVQSVSINAIAGKGFLYDTLIEGADGVMACQNREISYNNVDEGRILNKAQELGFKNLDELANLFDRPLLANNGGQYILTHSNVYETSNEDRKRPGRVAVEEVPMTIGYATYLVQMADQPGILPTITKGMKLSKDDISALRDMLNKDMNGGGVALKFMDFAVDMLSDLREQRYNGASLERYGTQLDNNENYFPVRRLEKNLRKDQVDLDEIKSDVASKVQASVTASALVKRVKSYTAIDIRQNPLRLMLDHVHEMNHFAATAPVVRNLQILLNSPAFKEQLNAQKNIAGNEKLNNYDRFELSAALAVGSFKPRTNTLNEVISSMQSLVAAGKVSWRFFTAAKQVLSLPAFVAYSTSWKYWGRLLRNISSLGFLPKKEGEKRCIHVVKWCMENIPTYRERWRERHAGDERIQSLSATRLAKWMYRTNFVTRWIQKKLIEQGGMWANAAVDIFVCGIGARSVYEYEVERLQERGMGKVEAEELAKRRAAIAFNETQQSSLNAFLSPAQRLKDFVSLYTSIFENSNRSYGRKASLAYDYLRTELMDDKQRKGRYELEVKREVARLENQMRRDLKAENELEPDFSKRLSDEMIENRISATRPTLRQKAEAEAMMKVREARKRAIAEWATYKFGLNFLWKISPMLATSLVMFDDDDEDKDGLNEYSAKKLLLFFVASYFRNGVGGATFESILDGYEFNTMLGQNIDMLWKNAERFIQGFREEEEEVDWQAFRLALNAVSNMSINVDLSTIGNVWKGVEGMIRDLSINTEDVLRLINAPKSMIAAAVIPINEGESEHDYIRRMAYMNAISPEQADKIEEAYSDSDYKFIFRDDLTSRDRAVKRKLDMWAKNYRAMKDAKILGVAYEKSLQGRITVPMLEELDDEYKKVLLAARRTASGEKRSDRKQMTPLTSEAKARITSMGLPRRIRKIHKLEKRLKGYSEIANDYASTLQEVVKLKESVVTEWNQKP